MNQGVHTVDLLLWLFGPVRRVFGKVATRLHAIEVEDTAVATLEFASGAIGTIEAATSAYPGYARQIALTGSEGTVKLDGDRLAAIDLATPRLPGDVVAAGHDRVSVAASSPVVSDVSAHRAVLEDFIAAIARGVPPSATARRAAPASRSSRRFTARRPSNQPVDL